MTTYTDQQKACDDAKNQVTLDRRDLWDYVRGAIHSALNDKIPKDCVASWAWQEATNRTMDLFQKIVDATPAPDAKDAQGVSEAFKEWFRGEWAQYQDKAISDGMVTSMTWALKGWKASRARSPERTSVIEECCAAIKAADDESMKEDIMLDSDQCITVLRALLATTASDSATPKETGESK